MKARPTGERRWFDARGTGREPEVRRLLNSAMMTLGLGGMVSIVLIVLVFATQLDEYIGKSTTGSEKLFVITLLAVMFLFIALIGAVIFVGAYVVSTINRQAAEARQKRLTVEDIQHSVMLGRGPAYLVGFDLAGMDFSWVRWLRGANLSGASLANANFENADLRGVDLERADLTGANLATADLRGANLREAILESCSLEGANLSDANLSQARLMGANLTGALLARTDLTRADLRGAELRDTLLEGAELDEARLPDGVGVGSRATTRDQLESGSHAEP